MRQVPCSALHRAACCLHVDPEEVPEEGPLEVAVYIRVVHDPHQLLHTQDSLTHRLDETVLTLVYEMIVLPLHWRQSHEHYGATNVLRQR